MPDASSAPVDTVVRHARPWTMVGLYALLVGLPAALVVLALGVGERLPAATGPVRVNVPGGTGTSSWTGHTSSGARTSR